MIALPVAHLVPGKGIEGDRYFSRSELPQSGEKTPYKVTFIEQEALEAFYASQAETVPEPGGRRNVVIRSCFLQSLVGCAFRIGEVVFRAAALHAFPYASSAPTQHRICNGLHHQWLGACILTEGYIRPGDQLEPFPLASEYSFQVEDRSSSVPLF